MSPRGINRARTVSAVAVVDLANELHMRGIVDEQALKDFGTRFGTLRNAWQQHEAIQEARLPESLLTRLWALAENQDRSDTLGLEIGSKVNVHAKGILANWLSHCCTLSEVFDTFSRNIHLLNPSERWERRDSDHDVALSLSFTSFDYPYLAMDRSMAAVLAWSKALTGHAIQPLSVLFSRPQPKEIAPYETLFGTTISFGQHENRLVFSKAMMDREVLTSNPYLKALLAKHASELSQTLGTVGSVKASVTRLLKADLPLYCQIETVCQALHVSRSTLYRKLKNEHTHFTALVMQARLELLERLEASGASHDVISDALGFRDSGSYYRFRKTL